MSGRKPSQPLEDIKSESEAVQVDFVREWDWWEEVRPLILFIVALIVVLLSMMGFGNLSPLFFILLLVANSAAALYFYDRFLQYRIELCRIVGPDDKKWYSKSHGNVLILRNKVAAGLLQVLTTLRGKIDCMVTEMEKDPSPAVGQFFTLLVVASLVLLCLF